MDNTEQAAPETITTNRANITFNEDAFFEKYSIVSYYGQANQKYLAYEQLSDLPTVSVAGIWARWPEMAGTRFFILTSKGKENEILQSLRQYDYIAAQIDDLSTYDDNSRKRIVASLCLNSLGKKKEGRMMYNDGSLLICDDKNFMIPKTRKELVCLKIEVDAYLILKASVLSFSNPRKDADVRFHRNCVFRVSNDIHGNWWSGQTIKPVVIKDYKDGEYDLNELYINTKRYADKRNNVPYWPYSPERYPHGRLAALWQVVDAVNKSFDGLVHIGFASFTTEQATESKPGKETAEFILNYLNGRTVFFSDPFQTEGSKAMIRQMKNEMTGITEGGLSFSRKQSANDLVVQLCRPIDEEYAEPHYQQSIDRLNGFVLQHVIFHDNAKEDAVSTAKARRILLELIIKDCNIKGVVPESLSSAMHGWEFYRYKINNDLVRGATLSATADGKLVIDEYGMTPADNGRDFEIFVKEHFHFKDCKKIFGPRDYMVMKKGGNVYLIIDTDEIPMLDMQAIDEGYDMIVNDNVPMSMFKRKGVAKAYLGGYLGFHIWKSEGIDGKPDSAFSYISGKNRENMKIMNNSSMDRMPRVRKIMLLNIEAPESVKAEIAEFESMLEFGFARWDEMMTYPFPFKLLYEYLDNACELAFSMHWDKITSKAVL